MMYKTNAEQNLEITVADRIIEPAGPPEAETRAMSPDVANSEQTFLVPGRFTAFLFLNQGRRLKISLMALVFITALYSKSYTGDFQQIINNHIGGVFYVLFGSLAFSVLMPHMKLIVPVVISTCLNCMLGVMEWLRFPFMADLTHIKVFAYIFGNTIYPEDFIFYGVGSVLAILVLWVIREN